MQPLLDILGDGAIDLRPTGILFLKISWSERICDINGELLVAVLAQSSCVLMNQNRSSRKAKPENNSVLQMHVRRGNFVKDMQISGL